MNLLGYLNQGEAWDIGPADSDGLRPRAVEYDGYSTSGVVAGWVVGGTDWEDGKIIIEEKWLKSARNHIFPEIKKCSYLRSRESF
jgi:hypothetical protein